MTACAEAEVKSRALILASRASTHSLKAGYRDAGSRLRSCRGWAAGQRSIRSGTPSCVRSKALAGCPQKTEEPNNVLVEIGAEARRTGAFMIPQLAVVNSA